MERQIALSLREQMRGGTLIVITHRPALAEIAGMVISVRDGTAKMMAAPHDALA